MATVTTYPNCACCGGSGSGSGSSGSGNTIHFCAIVFPLPSVLYLTITAVTGSCNGSLVGKTIPVRYTPDGGPLGTPAFLGDLFATPCSPPSPVNVLCDPGGGFNVFWNGAGALASGSPFAPATAPLFVTGSFNIAFADESCCPSSGGGGTITFILTETPP